MPPTPRTYDPRVPDDLPDLPEDLIQLQCDYETAHSAVTEYVARVEAEYRERYPDPGGRWDEGQALPRNAWTAEERAELQRLRDERETARKALWAHPEHGDGWARRGELKFAAGAVGWPEPKEK